MNKKSLIGIVLLIAAFGLYIIAPRTVVAPQDNNPVVVNTVSFSGKDSSFSVEGTLVRLVNGVAQVETAPGSASKTTIRYFGNDVWGDLNGDGKKDVAFLVTADGGGSGTFYYAVVALQTNEGFKTTNAFFIGDRIAPQNNEITAGELHVNYAERRAGEPFTVMPSMGAVTLLKVTSNGVLEGLMK